MEGSGVKVKVVCDRCERLITRYDTETRALTTSNKTRLGMSSRLERSPRGELRIVAACKCGAQPVVRIETIERRAQAGETTIGV